MPFHLLVYMVAIGLDFDKWMIWFFNMIKERNEEKRSQLMEQLRELEVQKNIGKSLEMPRNYIIKQTDLEVLKR